MDQAKRALKAELLELYDQALDEMFSDCPERADFTVLEEQVETLAQKMLPKTLTALVEERGLFPPKLPKLRK
jgi:phytoene/squalene synthetase